MVTLICVCLDPPETMVSGFLFSFFFLSDSFVLDNKSAKISGSLIIREKSKPISFDSTMSNKNNVLTMSGKLTINVQKANGFLKIIIEDNGIGRAKAKALKSGQSQIKTQSFGLSITKERMDLMKKTLQTRMNLEMAVTNEMLAIACDVKPTFCCLVPEKREELTTEGGLDVAGQQEKINQAVAQLAAEGIQTSLFIDADKSQIDAALLSKAPYIEIHTGCYADAPTEELQSKELARLKGGIEYAHSLGLKVNAGHGLHYFNVKPIAAIPEIVELNIGHAIIARAAIDGLDKAVRDMKRLMIEARL